MKGDTTQLLCSLVILIQLTIGIVSAENNALTNQESTPLPKKPDESPPIKASQNPPLKTMVQAKVCNSSPHFDATLFDHSIWDHVEVKSIRGTNPEEVYFEKYYFSLCSPLGAHNFSDIPANCSDSHVCHVIHNGSSVQVYGFKDLVFMETPHTGLTYVILSGENSSECSLPSFKGPKVPGPKTINLSFTCDPRIGLGRPVKKLSSPCNAQFNWPTIAACTQSDSKGQPISKKILSKCYTYDSNGDVRDLSPLIHEDGYEIYDMPDVNSTTSKKKFFINICSEVGKPCDKSGIAICSKTPGPSSFRDKFDNYGLVRRSTLHYDEVSEEVVLTYKDTSSVNYKCTHQTNIRFKCPKQSADVNIYGLESRKPFLLSSSECETVIEWETDHACPLHKLRGHISNCTIEDGDFKIDLSPLQRMGEIVLKNVTADSLRPNVTYDVKMSICGSFTDNKRCGDSWGMNAVCINSTDNRSLVIGTKANGVGPTESELAFNDGQITLVYPTNSHKNDLCPDKDASPVTTLNFVCDEKTEANITLVSKSPTCDFGFDVRTKHACHPPHLAVPSCSIEFNGTRFDLSPLRKKAHEYLWTASVNPLSFKSAYALNKDDRILINVCGGIPKSTRNNACEGVPSNSAACLYNLETKESRNIGQFVSAPMYDPASKTINLTYETTNVKSKKTASLITFKCAPGILDSSPVLVSRSSNSTVETFEFEWKSSAACPLKTWVGTDCMVTDETLGFKFDLNPLRRDHPYIVHDGRYDYHLNVCGELLYNPCVGNKIENTGVCQRNIKDNSTYVAGQFNSNLTYYDGVLKLTYYNGSKYRDPATTPRKAEILFVCDEEDDVDRNDEPSLEHVSENNRTYFFRWYTKHACPDFENIVPCLWTNGTHSIDLSPMSLVNSNHFEVTGLKRSTGNAHDRYYANVCRPLNPVRGMAECRKGSAMCWQSVDSHGNLSTISLGIPTSPPDFHDGNLAIVYENGDPCYDSLMKQNRTWSSMINFVCDSDEGPEGMFKPTHDGACFKTFEWRTSLVCDITPEVPHFHTTVSPSVTSKPAFDTGDGDRKGSKPGTGVIIVITVISFLVVLFALFIVVNREARNIMLFKVRSMICGGASGTSRSMYYSQLTTNEFNTSADQVAFISGHSSLSPYNPTTTSMYSPTRNSTGLTPLKNGSSNGSKPSGQRTITRLDDSVGVPFPMYDDDDIDLLT